MRAVMERLCLFFGLAEMAEGQLWGGILGSRDSMLVDKAISTLLTQLRPDMVALVDAFEFSDRVLGSDLGRYDGNVYEALYQSVRRPRKEGEEKEEEEEENEEEKKRKKKGEEKKEKEKAGGGREREIEIETKRERERERERENKVKRLFHLTFCVPSLNLNLFLSLYPPLSFLHFLSFLLLFPSLFPFFSLSR